VLFGDDIEAILFDMDGVLWASSVAHGAAYNAVFAVAGLLPVDYSGLAGRRTEDVFRSSLATDATNETIEALTIAKQTIARVLLRAFPPIVPGCFDVLSTLAASGRRLALVTSASAGTVRLFLDASGTATLFEVIISGHDVALAKPAPDIYKLALGKMCARPKQAAVVEDSPAGIEAARAADVAVVVGIEGTTSPSLLREKGANFVVSSLRELVN
jgi:HAD superfamily hydrolase (TIGR01509 family)